MNTTTKVLTGFVIGVAAGAAAGMLLAPQSGSITRRRLGSEGEKFLESLSTNVKDTVDETLNVLRKSYEAGAEELSRNASFAAKKAKGSLKVN